MVRSFLFTAADIASRTAEMVALAPPEVAMTSFERETEVVATANTAVVSAEPQWIVREVLRPFLRVEIGVFPDRVFFDVDLGWQRYFARRDEVMILADDTADRAWCNLFVWNHSRESVQKFFFRRILVNLHGKR